MNSRGTMPDDDRELMLHARRGSREAFEELVARYEGRLVSYFYRQCGDRDLAEDCAQEVFVRLYRARERYGPQARFATFLFTIARNCWIDVARARRVRPAESSLVETSADGEERDRAAMTTTKDPGPSEQVAAREDVRRLRDALGRLPAAQRDVVLLGVIEGLPYAEVSEVLGIPVGTVKSRVHAAVLTLRRLLGVDAITARPLRGGEGP